MTTRLQLSPVRTRPALHDVTGFVSLTGGRVHSATRPAGRTIIASLVAARLEEDNTIQLRIAAPYRFGATKVVTLPDVASGAAAGDRALAERMRAARAAFVETVGLPSFEAFTLLFGAARFTLSDPGDGGPARVLAFEALDGPAPPVVRRAVNLRPAVSRVRRPA